MSVNSSSRNKFDLDRSGAFTSKYGFSVVAPIRTSNPSSTEGSRASCCALLKRCTSSRNRIVPMLRSPKRRCASSITKRTSFTEADTADSVMNSFSVWLAINRAKVVFPHPGGPHKMMEVSRSASIRVLSGAPTPINSSWPTRSSSRRGRSRAASGALRFIISSAADSNRSLTATNLVGLRRQFGHVAGGSTLSPSSSS